MLEDLPLEYWGMASLEISTAPTVYVAQLRARSTVRAVDHYVNQHVQVR